MLGVGATDLAHIVVTHIHVDHAGGAGALLRDYPRSTLWVHERGARHLVDPTRLIASTERTYGAERMHRLYGTTLPCPEGRIRTVGDDDRIPLGPRTLRVVHTPGHASHHIALFDEAIGSLFTGEAIGSYLPWGPAFRPALPPPEVDVEAASSTIDRLEATRPTTLLTSHFGPVPDVEEAFDRARSGLAAWSGAAERVLRAAPDADDDPIESALREVAQAGFADEAGRPLGAEAGRYDVLGSIRMNAQGLGRYWRARLAGPERTQAS
jgi:glyoxylase-like metal-dependent hydrolase (beta-lactamase superfamily II)